MDTSPSAAFCMHCGARLLALPGGFVGPQRTPASVLAARLAGWGCAGAVATVATYFVVVLVSIVIGAVLLVTSLIALLGSCFGMAPHR